MVYYCHKGAKDTKDSTALPDNLFQYLRQNGVIRFKQSPSSNIEVKKSNTEYQRLSHIKIERGEPGNN